MFDPGPDVSPTSFIEPTLEVTLAWVNNQINPLKAFIPTRNMTSLMDNLANGILVLSEIFEDDLGAGPTQEYSRAIGPYVAKTYRNIRDDEIINLENQRDAAEEEIERWEKTEAIRMWEAIDQFEEYRNQIKNPTVGVDRLRTEIKAIMDNIEWAYKLMYDRFLMTIEAGEEDSIQKERASVLQKRFLLETLVDYFRWQKLSLKLFSLPFTMGYPIGGDLETFTPTSQEKIFVF